MQPQSVNGPYVAAMERQEGESSKHHGYRLAYIQMGTSRSVTALVRQLWPDLERSNKKLFVNRCRTTQLTAQKYGWVECARIWDNEQVRAEQLEIRKVRQKKIAKVREAYQERIYELPDRLYKQYQRIDDILTKRLDQSDDKTAPKVRLSELDVLTKLIARLAPLASQSIPMVEHADKVSDSADGQAKTETPEMTDELQSVILSAIFDHLQKKALDKAHPPQIKVDDQGS